MVPGARPRRRAVAPTSGSAYSLMHAFRARSRIVPVSMARSGHGVATEAPDGDTTRRASACGGSPAAQGAVVPGGDRPPDGRERGLGDALEAPAPAGGSAQPAPSPSTGPALSLD